MKGARNLTPGEIALARTMFGDAIDYASVRLVRRKWWLFQPKGIVMAPCGHIHFHPAGPNWRDDFSAAPLLLQGLFIHEMTHVWQAQHHGRFYLPLMRHPFCRYGYRLKEGRSFDRYGLEQQAELVRHRFLADGGVAVAQECDRGLLPFGPTVTELQRG
ncbi:MAG: vgr related protein [Sphingomonas bacterium]|nr:vgr related protein [Sphingomonas bacterium]